MLFNSPEFVFLFLPLVIFFFYFSRIVKARFLTKLWLISASLFFYCWWKVDYLPVIIISIIGNFLFSRAICTNKNKIIFVLGIIFNLMPLFYFKYFNFFMGNISSISKIDFNIDNIVLPLAISFFTFQQIAYLSDVYRSEKPIRYSFVDYFLFVTFFPQLIAGPIVHHYQLIPQFNSSSRVFHSNLFPGLILFSIGLFKKVVLADSLSSYANLAYDEYSNSLSFIDAWVGTGSYTLQLYFDFSGYADMAFGIAMMFNILLPKNFNSPYKSTSIKDFWSRWHITLSHWLRDYIYIPLGGNRKNTSRNVIVTFIVGGIWHGAGWGFIVWGAIHGLSLAVYNYWSRSCFRIPKLFSWALTMLIVHIGWVFFRAETLESSISIIRSMFFLSDHQISLFSYNSEIVSHLSIMLNVTLLLAAVCIPNSNEIIGRTMTEHKKNIWNIVLVFFVGSAFGVSTLFLLSTNQQEFLYFNF